MKVKFLITGAISTLIAFFTFPIIFKYFFTNLFFISFIFAQLINIFISFLLQKFYVFKIFGWNNALLIKFYVNAVKLQLLNYACLYFLINFLNFNVQYSNIIMTTLIAILSFYLHKNITFKIDESNMKHKK